MILLYAKGAFPMADDDGSVNWYMPEIRTIIPLDNFNIPKSLKKYKEKSDFTFGFSTNQLEVIKQCANRDETWISNELIAAYKNLIKMGHLHSVEVYQNQKLVGGLYGVTYKGAFFGESMFSLVSQASKTALIELIKRLNERDFVLLDVQYQTDHLQMFGSIEIPFFDFNDYLIESYRRDVTFI
ncbi:MAG: leucyl/phenylalanyl-tRNA--protein transferase [Melioribacteraceae bacterium]|nr:leucyl/phenylalanyl-tRNA--protein transferase [Melioribacteraceae bacterium]MCF8262966.1 leucyl/phenylalanyl-tRNA--protein transferase [Melioribacteraceae bacterium]MCF8413326.1 leucyl/phenylalanyl-tRNA--protein transferase [Melioribacteraceae bacterium]MCF8430601.1 leucyl/phenylalanyl-tRNA--protein transferase [Melioribacteraceae bacterium]